MMNEWKTDAGPVDAAPQTVARQMRSAQAVFCGLWLFASSAMGQVIGGATYADSSDFVLNTPIVAGSAYADSSDFVLNTRIGGSAYADSSDFVLDTTRGPTGYADSSDFVLDTRDPLPPVLHIFLLATDKVVVSWPSPSTGFKLQETTDLASASWSVPAEIVSDNGVIKYITVSPPTGNRFYRLIKSLTPSAETKVQPRRVTRGVRQWNSQRGAPSRYRNPAHLQNSVIQNDE